MDSTRQQRISKVIQKDLSDYFLLYTKRNPGVLVSVSEVRVSSDLSIAHVYVSIFPTDKAPTIFEDIVSTKGRIRGIIGDKERHQLRNIPELIFHNDNTLDQLAHIDELIKS